MQNTCPCGSEKSLDQCCGVYQKSRQAPTALALMKSRYVAYTNGNVDYLVETTHPLRQHNLSKRDIKTWSEENTWQRLEIVSSTLGSSQDLKGEVEFKAYFLDKKNKPTIHHEVSTFDKIDGKWYYSKGVIDPEATNSKPNRNDPCSCESGKKYKKCCG